MSLSNTNNFLSSLVQAGADAMTNLFYVVVGANNLTDETIKTSLTVRTSQITLPTATHNTSAKSFLTVSVDVPKAEIQIDKKVEITFRLDENYDVYQTLLDLQKDTSVLNNGYATNADASNGLFIKLYSYVKPFEESSAASFAIEEDQNYYLAYWFKDCWVSQVTVDGYDFDSTQDKTVKAIFYFYDYEDPQSLYGYYNGTSTSSSEDSSSSMTLEVAKKTQNITSNNNSITSNISSKFPKFTFGNNSTNIESFSFNFRNN